MAFTSGEVLTAANLNQAVQKLVARGRRTTPSSIANSTTNVAVLRLDDIPIKGGYAYRVICPGLAMRSTVADDVMEVVIRYTTDGSTPTTSSAILPGASARSPTLTTGSNSLTTTSETEYVPASDETLSLLMCIARLTGTGNVSLFADGSGYVIDMKVYCDGPDVGDTGTDL
jgi:hypothetical protein